MRFSARLAPIVRRAHEAFVAGDTGRALAELDAAAAAAHQAGDPAGELGARLAQLQAAGEADDDATLAPLEAVAEAARGHGLDEVYAVAVLERAERLRRVGRLGDAGHHAQVMIEWGERGARPALVGAAALSLGLTLRASGRLEDANGAFNGGLWAVGPLASQPAPDDDARDPLFPALPRPRQTLIALLVHHARTSVELGLWPRARESLDALAAAPLDLDLRAAVAELGVAIARGEGRRPDLDGVHAITDELIAAPPTQAHVSLLCRLALVDDEPAHALAVLAAAGRCAEAVGGTSPAEVALARVSVLIHTGRLDAAEAALADDARGPFAVERLLLTATVALARGTPKLAIEPALMAAALAAQRDHAAHTAAAWQLAATVYRRVGLVDKARDAREQAATFYRRTGLRARLAALEVERAWEALIEGRDDEAAAALAPLAGVSDPDLAAQAALANAALAERRGRPADGLPALIAAHDLLIDRGSEFAAVPLARAAQKLAKISSHTLSDTVIATLDWAAKQQLPEVDALFIPPRFFGESEPVKPPS